MRRCLVLLVALLLGGCTAPRTESPFGPPPSAESAPTGRPHMDARTLTMLTWLEAARGTTDEAWRTERVERIEVLHVAHPDLAQTALNDVGDLLDHVRQMTVADFENQRSALIVRLQGDLPSL